MIQDYIKILYEQDGEWRQVVVNEAIVDVVYVEYIRKELHDKMLANANEALRRAYITINSLEEKMEKYKQQEDYENGPCWPHGRDD